MSLLYCSLTRTAANWYDRLPQVYKDDWSSFLQIFKKQFYSQKHAYHAQIEALSLVKRHFALKVETLVKQGWYNEYPSTINLKCNEIFTRGLPKKLKDSANKRQVRHISNSFEPSIPFHSLVNMVDSEDITLEKIKTQELSLEINTLSNTFQQSTTIQDSPSESPQVQVMDPNNKSKPQFKKYCSFCHKNNHSVSTCVRRLNMLKESKPQSRSPTPTFYQHFKNPSNKSHYPRYRSRSHSNPSRRSFRDTRYQSRSYSRSHSRPRYNIKTPPVRIRLTTIVIDLEMINITITIPTNHTLLHEHIITLIPLVVHLNITLVLVNVPQILLLLLLIDTILLIVLLLNHAMIAIVVDLIQIQTIILNPNTNHP